MRASMFLLAFGVAIQSVFASVFPSASTSPISIHHSEDTSLSTYEVDNMATLFARLALSAGPLPGISEENVTKRSPEPGLLDFLGSLFNGAANNAQDASGSQAEKATRQAARNGTSRAGSGSRSGIEDLIARLVDDKSVAKRSPEPGLLDFLNSLFSGGSNDKVAAAGNETTRAGIGSTRASRNSTRVGNSAGSAGGNRASRNGTTQGSGRAGQDNTGATSKSSLRGRVTVADMNAIADATVTKVRRQQGELDENTLALLKQILGGLTQGGAGNGGNGDGTTQTTSGSGATESSSGTATGKDGSALSTGTLGGRGGAVGAAAAVRAVRREEGASNE